MLLSAQSHSSQCFYCLLLIHIRIFLKSFAGFNFKFAVSQSRNFPSETLVAQMFFAIDTRELAFSFHHHVMNERVAVQNALGMCPSFPWHLHFSSILSGRRQPPVRPIFSRHFFQIWLRFLFLSLSFLVNAQTIRCIRRLYVLKCSVGRFRFVTVDPVLLPTCLSFDNFFPISVKFSLIHLASVKQASTSINTCCFSSEHPALFFVSETSVFRFNELFSSRLAV